jgi:hypothetical protein
MRVVLAALMMSAPIAGAAPLPAVPAVPASAAAAVQPAPVVSADWAAPPPPPDKAVIRRAIAQTFAEEKAEAQARSKEAAIPQRYTASSEPERDKYEKFEVAFSEAKVPGCLKPDGLKRQPTFFLSGLLALPFIAVAAARGKCN